MMDLHVHAGKGRKLDCMEAARQAINAGLEAILFKDHNKSTTKTAAYVNRKLGKKIAYGSYVLNQGFNLDDVAKAIEEGTKIIYMPTINAKNQRQYSGQKGGLSIFYNGKIKLSVIKILELAKENDTAISTGHLSLEETIALVEKAKEIGTKIIITHPELALTYIPLNIQKQLVGNGVYFERTFYSLRNPEFPKLPQESYMNDPYKISKSRLKEMVKNIKEVGVNSTILSSDLGQPWNLEPAKGFAYFLGLMKPYFNESEIQQMTKFNPAFALGLDGITKEFIVDYTHRFVRAEEKRQQTKYRTPVIGFADADDKLFRDLKEGKMGYFPKPHKLPTEILPEAETVISIFLPFNLLNIPLILFDISSNCILGTKMPCLFRASS